MLKSAPISDQILFALAKMVDDAKSDSRFPSHSDLDFMVGQCGLGHSDPKVQGQLVGKAKRVRAVLSWALEHASDSGERLTYLLISSIQGNGGFRESSPNFVGNASILAAQQAFGDEGFELASDGGLRPLVLDSLSGKNLTAALNSYVTRARKGSADAALLAGTAKDLLEATAAHVLMEKNGTYSTQNNFPTLLGQAFIAVNFATSADKVQQGESPQRRLERALFDAGCAVNALRNKQGSGHGRPWLPAVTVEEARAAVEVMGVISGLLLSQLPK